MYDVKIWLTNKFNTHIFRMALVNFMAFTVFVDWRLFFPSKTLIMEITADISEILSSVTLALV